MTAHKSEPETKRLQVRIRVETYEALGAQARRELLPMAAVVRRILDNHVAALDGDATSDGGVS